MKFIILVASVIWLLQSQALAESWNYTEPGLDDPRQSLILERPPGEERQVSGTLTMAQLNHSPMSSSSIDIPPPEIINSKASEKEGDSWNVQEGRKYKPKYRVAKHTARKHHSKAATKLAAKKLQKKKNSRIARVLPPKRHTKFIVAHSKHHSGRHIASSGS